MFANKNFFHQKKKDKFPLCHICMTAARKKIRVKKNLTVAEI